VVLTESVLKAFAALNGAIVVLLTITVEKVVNLCLEIVPMSPKLNVVLRSITKFATKS
jgi:hypothetical protein